MEKSFKLQQFAVAIAVVSSRGWLKSVAVVNDVDSSRLGFKPKTLFLLFLLQLGSPTRAGQHSVCAMAQLWVFLFCFYQMTGGREWGGGGALTWPKAILVRVNMEAKNQQLHAHRQKSTKLMKTWKSMGRLASTPLTGSADSVSLSPLPPASPAFPSSPWMEVMTIMDDSYLSMEQKLSVMHIATVLRDLVHSFITPVHFCFCLVTDFCCKCPCTCVCCCMSLHVLFACLLLWFGLVSFVYFSRFLLLSRFFVGQLPWFLP